MINASLFNENKIHFFCSLIANFDDYIKNNVQINGRSIRNIYSLYTDPQVFSLLIFHKMDSSSIPYNSLVIQPFLYFLKHIFYPQMASKI